MKSEKAGYTNSRYRRAGNTYSRNTNINNRRYADMRYTGRSMNSSYRGSVRATANTRNGAGAKRTREYGYYSSPYSSYNNTSVAHNFYYDENIAVRRSKKSRPVQDKKEIGQLNMPKTIATIAVVFTLSLVLLCANAVNSSYRGEIASKQAELAEIQEENQYLKTSLEDNLDLDKIEDEAEKLGLQKPQAYQITEVQVPNESYTVQYDANVATQDKSVWEFVKGLLGK